MHERIFTQNLDSQITVAITLPKKDWIILLPYLEELSPKKLTRIYCIVQHKLFHCNLRFIFQTKCKIGSFLKFKDIFASFIRFNIFYNFSLVVTMTQPLVKFSFILKPE